MKKVSKSIKICIALGILFGLILLFFKLRLQLSEEELAKGGNTHRSPSPMTDSS